MSFAEVRDHALWKDNLYGNQPLQEKIASLKDGDQIELEVDGVRGTWARITGSDNGRPRPGLKASGEALQLWLALRDEKYAGIASVRDCSID